MSWEDGDLADNNSNETSYSMDKPIYFENPEDMLKPWIRNPLFLNIVITYSVAFLFGLVGNVVVMVVMIGDRKARNATNLFLVSLSAADLLLLVICAPLETLRYFVLQWDEGGAICKTAMYAELLSAVASVLNLSAVTLERFFVIVFPMKSRSVCTISNCRKAIIFVWFLALTLTVPVLVTKETYKMVYTNYKINVTLYYCDETEQGGLFALYQLGILFVAPGLLMIVCYTYVIKELWRSTRNLHILTNTKSVKKPKCQNGSKEEATRQVQLNADGESTVNNPEHSRTIQNNQRSKKHNKGGEARKQVIKMLILVIILFIICWGPRIIMEVIIKFDLHSFTQTMYTLRVTFNLLPYIHACMNPFIYSFMSKNFRRSLVRQMQAMGCHIKTRTVQRSSTRTSKSYRGSTTMKSSWKGFQFFTGRSSMSTSTTNCPTDFTRQGDVDPLQPVTTVV